MPVAAQSPLAFLEIPSSGRIAALGGEGVTTTEKDLSLFFHNPALLDSVESGQLYALYNPYLADIQRLIAAVTISVGKISNLALGVNYTGYGEIQRTDPFGNGQGTFSPRQYALYLGKSHRTGPFSLGVNLKFAASQIDVQNRFGLMTDLGGVYYHPENEWVIGMVIKNMGFEFGGLESNGFSEELFDVVVGTTFKPMYMPFRFTFTASNLSDYRSAFQNEGTEVDIEDRILRYLSLGTTLVISESIEGSVGYNHRRNRELSLSSGGYGAGFSFGMMVKVKDIEIRYSRISFHAAGGTSFISVQSNTNTIKKIF